MKTLLFQNKKPVGAMPMKNNNRQSAFLRMLPLLGWLACAFPVHAEDSADSPGPCPYSVSDGSAFVPQDYYPTFNWEVTPQYFMFGDTERTLLPANSSTPTFG
jgi:hypothetical protein